MQEGQFMTVNALSTAEEYVLHDLYEAISRNSEYEEVTLSEDLEDHVIALKIKSNNQESSIAYVFK